MPRLYNFQTNSYEDIPEQLVREKVLSKNYAFTDTEDVPVIAPDGSRHFIPGARVMEAFRHGGQYGSAEDLARLDRKDKYGDGWENYLGAAVTGAARGATLGMSDVALREILGRERMKTWREELSGTSTAAEIAGAILPTVFTGGAGGAATGARALKAGDALLASRGAFKAGVYAEKALANSAVLSRAADKGLALKIVSSSFPKAVGGALEGAAFGAGTSLTEAMLGDPDEASEMFLANIGYSALFGGLANAGIHATMMGGVGATRKMSDGFASIYEKATNSRLSIAGQKKLADLSGGLLGMESETLQKQAGLWADPKRARAEALAKEATFKQSQDDIVENLNGLLDDMEQVSIHSRGEPKRKAMRGQIFDPPKKDADAFLEAHGTQGQEFGEAHRAALSTVAMNQAEVVLNGASDAINVLKGSTGGYSWGGEVGKLSNKAQELLSFLGDSSSPVKAKSVYSVTEMMFPEAPVLGLRELKDVIKSGQETFLILDDYKKWLGQWAFGKNGRTQMDWNTQEALGKAWKQIHSLLEDTNLWGRAAETQRVMNPRFSRFISALQDFRKDFGDRVSKGKGKWQDEWVNTKKVGQFLKNLEGRGDNTMEASWGIETEKRFKEFFTAAEDFADTAQSVYSFEGKAAAATSSAKSRLSGTRSSVDNLISDMRETRFINEAAGGSGFHPRYAAAMYRRFGYGVFGGVTLGPVGAAAGFLLGGLADGASTARKLAMMENAIGRGRAALNTSLDGVIDRMAKGGPSGSIPLRPSRTKLFLGPLADQFGEGKEKERQKQSKLDNYTSAKKRAMQMADPEVLTGSINKVIEPIEHDMPMLSGAFKAKLGAGMGHAVEGFNKDNRTIEDQIMGVPERQPTDREMAQTEIRLAVLEDPIGECMGNLEAGTLTTTHVDMLEKCYPSIYQNMVAGLMDRMSVLTEEGNRRVHHSYRTQLSIMFKRPFDSSFKTENISILQGSYGEDEAKGAKVKSSPLIAHPGIEPTKFERIAAVT